MVYVLNIPLMLKYQANHIFVKKRLDRHCKTNKGDITGDQSGIVDRFVSRKWIRFPQSGNVSTRSVIRKRSKFSCEIPGSRSQIFKEKNRQIEV